MKVLLVNPPIYDFAAYDLWIKPVGLLKIGRVLKDNGFDVLLFDFLDRFNPNYRKWAGKTKKYNTGKFYAEKIDKPDVLKNVRRYYRRYGLPSFLFIEKLKEFNPDYVFITSVMTYWYFGVKEVIDTVRKYSNAKIVVGGVYATLLKNHAEGLNPDIVVSGDASEFFEEEFNIEVNFYNTLPDYSFYKYTPVVSLNLTYGCPYRCSYCASSSIYPKFVKVNADFDRYLYQLDKKGIKDIAFLDDALIVDKKHFIEFANISSKYSFRFHIPNGVHIKLLDEEIGESFKEMGVVSVRLSVESISERELNHHSYKTGIDYFINSVSILKKYGIKEVGAYILAGLPFQIYDDIIKTMEFVNKMGVRIHLCEYAPVPCSLDFNMSEELRELDPLLHNNTVYSGMFTLGWKNIERLKNYAKELNRKL